jgi:hypothetical protein
LQGHSLNATDYEQVANQSYRNKAACGGRNIYRVAFKKEVSKFDS